ncbi:MAG: hypothetical protein ACYTGS_22335, partial [Planctomycetota bacterium]
GTGKTTAEMQMSITFTDWVNCCYGKSKSIWTIDEGNDYPRLWWENAPGDVIELMQQCFMHVTNPRPPDGAIHEDTWVSLSWSPGDCAVSHSVYFGDNFDDVKDGIGGTFRGNRTSTSYVAGLPGFAYPDGLVPGTTYYWRIDEVNDTEPNSPWKGNVWSFSIPRRDAYNPDPANGAESVEPDAGLRWTPGFGAKLHIVYFSDNFDNVNTATGGVFLRAATYYPGQLELAKTYYWRVDEFDGVVTHKGDVWSFTTIGAMGSPVPANGAVDVTQMPILTWNPGDYAASHDVYFGTDAEEVRNATKVSPEYKGTKALRNESYVPGKLRWDTTYYWRVDAVYDVDPANPVKGLVWSFTTANFLIVDDFESYNDIDPPDPTSKRIFDVWMDGYGITTNGDEWPHPVIPAHGGKQLMPYSYDNNLKTSEATITLVWPRDWTMEGVTKLSLWFRGDSANATERMFVALNGTSVVYHDDPAATQKTGWNEWVIDLTHFADQGVNLTHVNTMTIGFGTKNNPTAGGFGQMYFDDIRLYRPM